MSKCQCFTVFLVLYTTVIDKMGVMYKKGLVRHSFFIFRYGDIQFDIRDYTLRQELTRIRTGYALTLDSLTNRLYLL